MIETKERREASRAVEAHLQVALRPTRKGRRGWIAGGVAAVLGAGLAVGIILATTGGNAPAGHASIGVANSQVTSMRPFSDGAYGGTTGSQVTSMRPFSDGGYGATTGSQVTSMRPFSDGG
jgi:hypothetical protein